MVSRRQPQHMACPGGKPQGQLSNLITGLCTKQTHDVTANVSRQPHIRLPLARCTRHTKAHISSLTTPPGTETDLQMACDRFGLALSTERQYKGTVLKAKLHLGRETSTMAKVGC